MQLGAYKLVSPDFLALQITGLRLIGVVGSRLICNTTYSTRLGIANVKPDRFSVQKISTLAVQCLASVTFAKLPSSPVTTLPSAYFTCAELLTVLLDSRRFEATHNPLVHAGASTQPRPEAAPTPDYATASWLTRY